VSLRVLPYRRIFQSRLECQQSPATARPRARTQLRLAANQIPSAKQLPDQRMHCLNLESGRLHLSKSLSPWQVPFLWLPPPVSDMPVRFQDACECSLGPADQLPACFLLPAAPQSNRPATRNRRVSFSLLQAEAVWPGPIARAKCRCEPAGRVRRQILADGHVQPVTPLL